MADCARPSFWKVPREFREASPLPGSEADHLYYQEVTDPAYQDQSNLSHTSTHWGFTPLEKANKSLSNSYEMSESSILEVSQQVSKEILQEAIQVSITKEETVIAPSQDKIEAEIQAIAEESVISSQQVEVPVLIPEVAKKFSSENCQEFVPEKIQQNSCQGSPQNTPSRKNSATPSNPITVSNPQPPAENPITNPITQQPSAVPQPIVNPVPIATAISTSIVEPLKPIAVQSAAPPNPIIAPPSQTIAPPNTIIAPPINPSISFPAAPIVPTVPTLDPIFPLSSELTPNPVPLAPTVPSHPTVPMEHSIATMESTTTNTVMAEKNNNDSNEWIQMFLTLKRNDTRMPWGFSLIHPPTCPLIISKVCSLSSAFDAGLKSGDVLLSVNSNPIAGKSLQGITEQISRDNSNQINLGIARGTSPNYQQQQIPTTSFPTGNFPIQQSYTPSGASYSPVTTTTNLNQRTPSPARALSQERGRGISPAANLTPNQSTMYQPFGPSYCSPSRGGSFRPLDPHSAIDQEVALFEEQRRDEQQAIRTTPYRNAAVVSPKPKVRHDHPTGCYLQMQGYKDAPTHYLPTNNSPIPPQARLNDMIHQIGVRDPNVQVKLPYNTPIGLYSQQNAMSELQRNSAPHLAGQPMQQQPMMNYGNQPMGPPSKPIWLTPDQLMDGSDFNRNLASSPTLQFIQEMERPGAQPIHRDRRAVSPMRARSPIPHYIAEEAGFIDRTTPQQSATFKILETSLLTHPGC